MASRIMIVDDEQGMRDSYLEVLEAPTRKLSFYSTGEEAVDAYNRPKEEWPHIIFTDFGMPGAVDGLRLAKTARNHDKRVKVCMVSATQFSEETLREIKQYADVLKKPVGVDDILGIAEKYERELELV